MPLSVDDVLIQQLDSSRGEIGVSSTLVSRSPSPQLQPYSFPASLFGGGSGSNRQGSAYPRGEGSGVLGAPPIPGFLREDFCGTEEQWRVSPCSGSVGAQQLSSGHPFPNGIPLVCQRGNAERGLGLVTRPKRRLLSCSSASKGQEVPPFHLEGFNLSVQRTPFRSVTGSLGLHQSHQGTSHAFQIKGDQNSHVSRRLAHSGSISRGMCQSHRGSGADGTGVGVLSELGEVCSPPSAALHLPGDDLRHSAVEGFPYRREATALSLPSEHPHGVPFLLGTQALCPSGSDGVTGSDTPTGSSTQAYLSKRAGGPLGPVNPGLGGENSHQPLVESVYCPVAQSDVASGRSTNLPPSPRCGTLHRCFQHRLGCACGESHCSRDLGSTGAGLAHQPTRDASSVVRRSRVCNLPLREGCPFGDGQYYSRLLPQQGGGDPVSASLRVGRVGSPSLSGSRHCSQSSSCSREDEHTCRSVESSPLRSRDRVDFGPLRSRASMGNVAQTSHRSFFHSVQSQATDVRISGPRPTSLGRRCSVDVVERSICLRLSSMDDSREGSQEDQVGQTVNHSDRPKMAGPSMVPGPVESLSRSAAETDSDRGPSPPTEIRDSASKCAGSTPSRLAAVQQKLQSLGASERVRDLVTTAHRAGTHAVYSSHWSRWVKWCEENSISPTSPTNVDVANFLGFLQSKGKATSTIRVHRAAICTTLRQLGLPSFSEDFLIRDTLKGASVIEARSPRRCPSWDLFLVLDILKQHPFEPLVSATLKFLSFKTIFLVALASGRRISEVNHLSGLPQDIAREPDGSLSLKFLPEFLAKNQQPGDPSPSIRIPPLPLGPDRFLCPVRSLKRYLHFTKSFRGSKRKLFISHNPRHKRDLTVNTVSRWVRELISLAYSAAPPTDARPHELRAWSSSLALSLNVAMDEIMAAAYWKTSSAFISHYLRDVTHHRQDGRRGLSYVAVAQRSLPL